MISPFRCKGKDLELVDFRQPCFWHQVQTTENIVLFKGDRDVYQFLVEKKSAKTTVFKKNTISA